MLLSVFGIFDTAVQTWRTPVFCRTRGQVIREFSDAVNNPQTEFAKHPSDYVLFELGTFDDDKCKFDLLAAPIRICIAIDLVRADMNGQGSGERQLPQQSGA